MKLYDNDIALLRRLVRERVALAESERDWPTVTRLLTLEAALAEKERTRRWTTSNGNTTKNSGHREHPPFGRQEV